MARESNFRLDMKDRKILYELDSNSRQTDSQIGKKIGLSSEVVRYRIKRLENMGIITQYQLVVNLSALEILQFKVCLELQHIKSEELEEIINKLRKNSSVKWIVSCKGGWDVLIALEADSLEDVDKLKDGVLNLFRGYIHQKAISILIEASTYSREYLLDADKSRERIIMKQPGKIKIDEVDNAILRKLSENARMSIVEIATKLRMSERIVNYRIRQLIKKKIILGFKIAINYGKLGLCFHKAFVYLDSPSSREIKSLVSYFESQKNIIHHVRVLGNWDFEPEFETSSEGEFDNIIKDLKDKFSDTIKKIEVLTILKEHKFVYF